MGKKPGRPKKITVEAEWADNLNSDSPPGDFPTVWEADETVKLNITVKDAEGKVEVDEDVEANIDALINKHVFLAHTDFIENVNLDLGTGEDEREAITFHGFDGMFTVHIPFSEFLDDFMESVFNVGPEERLYLEAWADIFERAAQRMKKRASEVDEEKD